MKMKTMKFYNGDSYVNPACHIVEVSAEGLLCTSTAEEDFNSVLDPYIQKDETYW